MICLAVTTASTDRHKDHTHQEPERAELNNTCREATSRGIPGAGSDSYCPTSSTGCWEICSVSSTGADIWIWRISQGSSTTRSEEMLHPAALGTQSWWLLSTLLSHGTSLHCLSPSAASATPNLLGRSSSFVNHPQVCREDPIRKMA